MPLQVGAGIPAIGDEPQVFPLATRVPDPLQQGPLAGVHLALFLRVQEVVQKLSVLQEVPQSHCSPGSNHPFPQVPRTEGLLVKQL